MQSKWQNRPEYLNRIRPFYQTDLIKVLLGQRRVGKSGLLHLIRGELESQFPGLPILHIEKEKLEWSYLRSGADLAVLVAKTWPASPTGPARSALLIDEVQELEDFAPTLRSLAASGLYDLYLTGSNSQLLSGEMATHFAGRSVNFVIHSLSYREFLDFHHRMDADDSLALYLRFGGMPYLCQLGLKAEVVHEYLQSLVDTIVLRDVVARFRPRNVGFLRRLLDFVADTTGSILSAKSIADFLKSQRLKATPQLVLDYLEFLQAAFLIQKTNRYDLVGKKLFVIGEKYYFEDWGIRNTLRGYQQSSLGQILENAVWHHLAQQGWRVHTGRWAEREIDFVAEKGDDRVYVQVTLTVADPATRQREFGNLRAIDDNYEKYVVSLDTVRANEAGIKHLAAREFLLLRL
ncbi:MAG: ATP-binding protein [Spirochaetales bacterium]